MKVLILEDSPHVQEMLEMFFETYESITITMVENGAQGLEKARQEKFDLIISDVKMPVMGGFEFGLEFRKTSNEPHIMYFSAEMDGAKYFSYELSKIENSSFVEKNYDYLRKAVEHHAKRLNFIIDK